MIARGRNRLAWVFEVLLRGVARFTCPSGYRRLLETVGADQHRRRPRWVDSQHRPNIDKRVVEQCGVACRQATCGVVFGGEQSAAEFDGRGGCLRSVGWMGNGVDVSRPLCLAAWCVLISNE